MNNRINRPPTIEQVRAAQRFYVDASAPFVRLKARILCDAMPSYLLNADGLQIIDDGLSNESRALIATIDDAIAFIHRRAVDSITR